MTTSTPGSPPETSRQRGIAPSKKILVLGTTVVLVVAAYTAGWFYFAGQLQERIETTIAGLQDQAIEARCDNLQMRGYPFRIGVFCTRLQAVSGTQRAGFSASAFRSAAQVYRPNHVVSEIDGPLSIDLPEGGRADILWETLQASTVFNRSGLTRASLEGTDMRGTFSALPEIEALASENVQLHLRQNGADLDAAVSAQAVRPEGTELPASLAGLDLAATVTLAAGADYLSGRAFSVDSLRASSGQLHGVSATLPDGASLTLSGPYQVAENGQISGTFDIAVGQLERWQAVIAELAPQAAGPLGTITGLLGSLAADDGTLAVTINVRDGRAFLGFIPIGSIPPI
jgi:hypothetical protein